MDRAVLFALPKACMFSPIFTLAPSTGSGGEPREIEGRCEVAESGLDRDGVSGRRGMFACLC